MHETFYNNNSNAVAKKEAKCSFQTSVKLAWAGNWNFMCLKRTAERKVLYSKGIVSIKTKISLKCYVQSRDEELLKADSAVSPRNYSTFS